MIKVETVRKLERLIARLEAAHEELSKLVATTPDAEMSPFKRRIVSDLVEAAAAFPGIEEAVVAERSWLKGDKVTCSDAVVALAQYIRALGSIRYDNALFRNEKWYWDLESAKDGVRETPYVPLARPKVE